MAFFDFSITLLSFFLKDPVSCSLILVNGTIFENIHKLPFIV